MPRPPAAFHGFIGQGLPVRQLAPQIAGAKARGENCPHLILIGPSGIGKSKLADAIGKNFGTEVISVHGQDKPGDIARRLLLAKAGDFLFVDEAHAADPRLQELLYEVIDRTRIPGWAMQGGIPFTAQAPHNVPPAVSGAATMTPPPDYVEVQPISIILATDQPGKLRNALLKRMELTLYLHPYPQREMEAIVDRIATDLNLSMTGQARNELARVSNGLPRDARHHLRNLRRYLPAGAGVVGIVEVREFLRLFNVDAQGLKAEHRGLLRHLGKLGRASLDTLAAFLGTDVDYLARQVEPQLMRLGLVRIGPGGRTLTDAGRQWLTTDIERRANRVQPAQPVTNAEK